MKVCTDACLFGALTATLTASGNEARRMLDIGTGTGLLALMLAQKSPGSIIDAIEIDGSAAQQAAENFDASPWEERLTVYHISIQQFTQLFTQSIDNLTDKQYDVIVSNPPFFDNDLKSVDNKRNLALHSEALSLEELLDSVNSLLKEDGVFGALLPYHRTAYFEKLALGYKLYLSKKVLIKQTPGHSFFRSILFFGRKNGNTIEREIVIKNDANAYSSAFIELLQDYYLYL